MVEFAKPHYPPAQITLEPTLARRAASHQRVRVRNTSPVQVHIVVDRNLVGHELQPGQVKELDMLVDEIEAFRALRLPGRGFITNGPLAGIPKPPHPLVFEDIPEPKAVAEAVEAAQHHKRA
jgi:hypothetical protein